MTNGFKRVGAVSASGGSWRYEPTLHCSPCVPHSLCSTVGIGSTRPGYALPPITLATPQSGGIRFALDHGQQPSAGGPGSGPGHQPTGVARIGPDDLQPGKSTQELGQYQLGAVPVLNAGRVNHRRQEQPHGVHYDMALASGDLLTGVIAPRPPFPVVFTDWLSILEQSGMAALGVASRPAASRTRERKASATPAQVPSSRHRRKYHHTVPQGGRSWGIRRQGMPPRSTYSMPLTTSRRSVVLGRSLGFGRGQQGSQLRPLGIGQITGISFPTHAASVTSIPGSPQEPTAQLYPIVTHPLRGCVTMGFKQAGAF